MNDLKLVFLSSFDPITNFDLKTISYLVNKYKIEKTYFSIIKNVVGKRLKPFKDRQIMLNLVINRLKKAKLLPFILDLRKNNYDYFYLLNSYYHNFCLMVYEDDFVTINNINFDEKMKKIPLILLRRNKSKIKIFNLNKHFQLLEIVDIKNHFKEEYNYSLLPIIVRKYITNKGLYLQEMVKKELSNKRYKHTISVMKTALLISKNNNLNRNEIKIACLLHDIAKEYDLPKLKRIIKKYYPDHLKDNGMIYHQYVGEYISKTKYKIENNDILNAICYHTTANMNMSKLAKTLYSSDKIEPLRGFDNTYLLSECIKDIEEGFKKVLKDNLDYMISKNITLMNEETKKAINEYLKDDNQYQMYIDKCL